MISGRNKRNHVGADGELEAGEDFFGNSGAAEHVTALEHQNFFAGAGEVGGVDQAVVASADHDDVVFDFDPLEAAILPSVWPSRIAAILTGAIQE